MALSIGVVVHGPEVIDSGLALAVLDWLEEAHEVTSVLGGTMGRVAVMDYGLEHRIDITSRLLPSQSVVSLQDRDLVILLNQAKSRETGLVFGKMVAARADPRKPLIMADFGGGYVITLHIPVSEDPATAANLPPPEIALAQALSERFSLEWLTQQLGLEEVIGPNGNGERHITGVQPGEAITVNGTVVARATSPSVILLFRQDRIVSVKGAVVKEHGLEKLSRVDPRQVIIRSGSIRRTRSSSTRFPLQRNDCSLSADVMPPQYFRGNGIAVVDHFAEGALEVARGCYVAITVGDDTTAVAGNILSRLYIPVVGIVDGDPDDLGVSPVMARGSCIIRVRAGKDDLVGRKVKDLIKDLSPRPDLRDLARRVGELAGKDLVAIEEY